METVPVELAPEDTLVPAISLNSLSGKQDRPDRGPIMGGYPLAWRVGTVFATRAASHLVMTPHCCGCPARRLPIPRHQNRRPLSAGFDPDAQDARTPRSYHPLRF